MTRGLCELHTGAKCHPKSLERNKPPEDYLKMIAKQSENPCILGKKVQTEETERLSFGKLLVRDQHLAAEAPCS